MHGIIPAVPTPVRTDFTPDLDAFLEHARFVIAAGCHGINVLGTTGEANSLSVEARRTVMSAAARSLAGTPMMVGTGTCDLESTIALTRQAYELGFSGALVLPPFYYKPIPDDALADWIDRLVAATRATPIELYLYNFPKLTGLAWSADVARTLATRHSGRVVGAKDSSNDQAYARALADIPGFRVFPSDERTVPLAKREGFAGCISASVNVSAALSACLWRAPEDEALARRVGAVREALQALPLISAVKVMVGARARAESWDIVLPPQPALSPAEKGRLRERVEPLLV